MTSDDINLEDLKDIQQFGPTTSFYEEIVQELCKLAGFEHYVIGDGIGQFFHVDVYPSKESKHHLGKMIILFKKDLKVHINSFDKCLPDLLARVCGGDQFDLHDPESFQKMSAYMSEVIKYNA